MPPSPRSLPSRVALTLIRLYQLLLSPLLGGQCRFYPSCSCYAAQAFEIKPFWTAFRMTIVRLAKCQPFHPGGYDPVEPDLPANTPAKPSDHSDCLR
ncbi:TPA: membrane protein insertion efficiency factor YidD [Candidatus Sumerlaeota bacterium]|jgi:uncharacterized protein|nr:membrane protein insertion efficiency factor YidD [Candidatus Sumerlaeota bacterium]